MKRQERIHETLTDAFNPIRLFVIDESHQHAGHQKDMDGTGETHMRIRIESAAFNGMSRLQRHRAVNDLLNGEFGAGLHALAVEAVGEGEATRW